MISRVTSWRIGRRRGVSGDELAHRASWWRIRRSPPRDSNLRWNRFAHGRARASPPPPESRRGLASAIDACADGGVAEAEGECTVEMVELIEAATPDEIAAAILDEVTPRRRGGARRVVGAWSWHGCCRVGDILSPRRCALALSRVSRPTLCCLLMGWGEWVGGGWAVGTCVLLRLLSSDIRFFGFRPARTRCDGGSRARVIRYSVMVYSVLLGRSARVAVTERGPPVA